MKQRSLGAMMPLSRSLEGKAEVPGFTGSEREGDTPGVWPPVPHIPSSSNERESSVSNPKIVPGSNLPCRKCGCPSTRLGRPHWAWLSRQSDRPN